VELAQKARDDLMLRRFLDPSDGDYLANPWAVFSDESGTYAACFANGCGLEITDGTDGAVATPVACPEAPTDPPLCDLVYDPSAGNERSRYTHQAVTGVVDTPYQRVVRFETINPNEVRVVSTVSWFTGQSRRDQTVSVETVLVNIYGP
jgi:hypothetical protein